MPLFFQTYCERRWIPFLLPTFLSSLLHSFPPTTLFFGIGSHLIQASLELAVSSRMAIGPHPSVSFSVLRLFRYMHGLELLNFFILIN